MLFEDWKRTFSPLLYLGILERVRPSLELLDVLRVIAEHICHVGPIELFA